MTRMTTRETRISIHVQPNASRNTIVGFKDGILYVRIAAPAVEGKANHELVRYLSAFLGVRKSDVSVDRGATGRNKLLSISGIRLAELEEKVRQATENQKT